MLGVHSVPTLADVHARSAEKSGDVAENQLVHFLLIEDVNTKAVLMRIAERDFAGGRLRYQAVNPPLLILGCFLGDAPLQRREGSAHAEGRIKTKSQSGGQ